MLATKAPATPVFKMPAKGDVVRRMLRPDLELAGIEYVDECGRYADFHALRHSFITHVGRSGAHFKTQQELARHSTPVLTARYSHGFKNDEIAAVNALPSFPVETASSEAKTGTDDTEPVEPRLARHLAQKRAKHDTSADKHGQSGDDDNDVPAHEKTLSSCEKRGKQGESGEGGIRTRGRANKPYDDLANRCLQPLGHLSGGPFHHCKGGGNCQILCQESIYVAWGLARGRGRLLHRGARCCVVQRRNPPSFPPSFRGRLHP